MTTCFSIYFSGDFGDFASFVAHMKEIAIVRVFSLNFLSADVLSL
jgi:hypothetical protein